MLRLLTHLLKHVVGKLNQIVVPQRCDKVSLFGLSLERLNCNETSHGVHISHEHLFGEDYLTRSLVNWCVFDGILSRSYSPFVIVAEQGHDLTVFIPLGNQSVPNSHLILTPLLTTSMDNRLSLEVSALCGSLWCDFTSRICWPSNQPPEKWSSAGSGFLELPQGQHPHQFHTNALETCIPYCSVCDMSE